MRHRAARTLMRNARTLLDDFDWQACLGESWGRRPAVLRSALPSALIPESAFLDALVACHQGIVRGEAREVALYDQDRVALPGSIASGGRSISPLVDRLPKIEDGDLDGYASRLTRDPQYQRFGLFMNRVHEFPGFWFPIRELIRGLQKHVLIPFAPLNTDVFIGNYLKTMFGAHRDAMGNLMVMVKGTRTIRLWSPEAFRGAMGDCDPSDTFQDYSGALDASQAFELHPGDLLYWPADHWHVGEGDGELSVSFNLGFPVTGDSVQPPTAVLRAMENILSAQDKVEAPIPREGGTSTDRSSRRSGPTDLIRRSVQRIRELMSSARFEQTLALEALRWETGERFDHVPAAMTCDGVHMDAWLWVDPTHPIRHTVIDGQLAIAACGHGALVPLTEHLLSMIERLNGGEPCLVADLVIPFQDSGPEAGDAALRILDDLVRFRGAFVVDIRDHAESEAPSPIGSWPAASLGELRTTPQEAPDLVRQRGIAWVEGVLGRDRCDELAKHIHDLREKSKPEDLGAVHESRRRFDLPLPLDPTVQIHAAEIFDPLKSPLLELTGANPTLLELSSLTSLPGAKAQTEHPDSKPGRPGTARMWTIFVSLADIDPSMGPLSAWPDTHRSRFFEHEELRREVLSPERRVALSVPQGSAIIMDSRTWHRGGANRSQKARPVVYFSFAEEGWLPKGPTYTIQPELAGRVSLDDLLTA